MKFLSFFVTLCVLVSGVFAANEGKILYKTCKGCHGVDGRHVPYEKTNGVLAGRNKLELELIIKAIYDGNYTQSRVNSIMKKTISKLNKEDIPVLAEYISKFKN